MNRRHFLKTTAPALIRMTTRSPQPPLVFIHGIKGSGLADTHGSVHWFTAFQALGLTAPDLRLPLHWSNGVQQRDDLHATAPLDSVAWHDVYAPFLRWAAATRIAFHPFAYDWRRDNFETLDGFIQFLDKVRSQRNGAKIQVVAHSMGGLITLAAIHRRPDLFQSVLFAGVPFGGCISFVEDLHSGTDNGFNSRILGPQVLFTFPSVYTLLPSASTNSELVENNGAAIAHNWYAAEDWERLRLGVFATGTVSPEQRTHLRIVLERAQQFRNELAFRPSFSYPPIAVLAGDNTPTCATIVHNGRRSVKGWDFASAPRQPGDNRVEFSRATPPPGIRFSVHQSRRLHEDLLNEFSQVESILQQFGYS